MFRAACTGQLDAAGMTTPDTTPVSAVPAKPAAVSAPAPAPVENLPLEARMIAAESPEAAAVVAEMYEPDGPLAEEPAAEPEPEKWAHEPDWKYDELDFKGDLLAIKIPSKGMLNAIAHAATTSAEFQTKLIFDFETIHISEASRQRVIERLMADDDPEYTGDEWEELQAEVLKLGSERLQKDAEELAKVKD